MYHHSKWIGYQIEKNEWNQQTFRFIQDESIYWLTLLKRTSLIEYNYDELLSPAEEIKRMLIASLNTAKENK